MGIRNWTWHFFWNWVLPEWIVILLLVAIFVLLAVSGGSNQ